MTIHKLLLLAGDGVGPEVMAETEKVVGWFDRHGLARFELERDLVGGAALDDFGTPLRPETVQLAKAADAVLFGAIGGPKWDGKVPFDKRAELAVLGLRQELALFANLRPAVCFPGLEAASSLKPELVQGLDIMIVRELTGGLYFNHPKEIVTLESGEQRGTDTQSYTTGEIERIARVAFELARTRRNKMTSTEKRNVMRSGLLWNQVVTRLHQREFADVTLEHQLADSCGMQLVRNPKQFDVLLCDNLFGDLLSDVASMLTGSIGMLPSASLGAADPGTGKRPALYEPIHGSAPDIAGRNLANPVAMMASFGMALRTSFRLDAAADLLDRAIADVLRTRRTPDISVAGTETVGTREMGEAVIAALDRQAAASPPAAA